MSANWHFPVSTLHKRIIALFADQFAVYDYLSFQIAMDIIVCIGYFCSDIDKELQSTTTTQRLLTRYRKSAYVN